MTPLEHERFSELLRPYVQGELDASTEAEVDSHLASCGECSAELVVVRAFAADAGEGLTEIERARLHSALSAELGRSKRAPDILVARRDRRAWIPQALGAAALLVAGLIGYQVLDGGGDSADRPTTERGGADEASNADVAGPQPVTIELEPRPTAVSGFDLSGTDRDTQSSESEAPEPETDPAPDAQSAPLGDARRVRAALDYLAPSLTTQRLDRYAQTKEPFVAFSATYTVADAEVLQSRYLGTLEREAPAPDDAAQIRRCAQEVIENQPYPLLPAAAMYGTLEDREALMLGFVWTDEETGPLERFMVWAWPRGSCDAPLHFGSGEIRQ